MKFTTLFSYYGGKARLSARYPVPLYRSIVEPFAGGAAYSLRYCDRDVFLNDLWTPVVDVWRLLTSADALHIVRERVPKTVKRGFDLRSIYRDDDPPGLRYLMGAGAGLGKFVRQQVFTVSQFGENEWPTFLARLDYWIPRITHWRVNEGSYEAVANCEATWFVDPPYLSGAGNEYRKPAKNIDFPALGSWCRQRVGQVIVCENDGATWLPFSPISAERVGINYAKKTSRVGEAVCLMSNGVMENAA